MKYSLHTCSLRSYTPKEAIIRAADMGYDGYELDISPRLNSRAAWYVYRDRLKGDVKALHEIAQGAGIAMHSLCLGLLWCVNLAAGLAEERIFAQEIIRDCAGLCKSIGGDTLLIPVGTPFEYDPPRARENLIKALRDLTTPCGDLGIVLAVENISQRLIWDADDLIEVIDGAHSPVVQAYFDTGNSELIGIDPVPEILKLGKRIWQMHIKDMRLFKDKAPIRPAGGYGNNVLTRGDSYIWDMGETCDLGDGGIDWQGVAEAIQAIGFDRYMVNEVVGRESEPDAVAINNLRLMKGLVKA